LEDRLQKVIRLLGATALLVTSLFWVSGVSAHRPDWGAAGNQITIDNLQTSFAFYRGLTGSEDVDVYTINAHAGDHLHAGINIPAIAGLNQYTVTVAVTGPGLPPANQGDLPAAYADVTGALVFHSKIGQDFFEPFTQTNYWGRQRIELNLPRSGVYHLLVWNPDGLPGKYVMDTGETEVFGPADVFNFPIWWYQVHTFFGEKPGLVLAVAAACLALAALIISLLKRSKQPGAQ
jgi:hypothetical protein